MDRRLFLAGSAAFVAAPALSQTPLSLGDLAAAKGIRFGSATGVKTGGLTIRRWPKSSGATAASWCHATS